MAIQWQTQSNLGVVANGNVVSTTLTATTNQSFEVNTNAVISPTITYTLLAGSFPTGLSLTYADNVALISGTAGRATVTGNQQFTIRATETIASNLSPTDGNITLLSSDRSFYYYWVGPTSPIISNTIVPRITVGNYYEYQLTVDNDATDVQWTLSNSTLQPNLRLESNGVLRGYMSPADEEFLYFNVRAENNIGSNIATYQLPVLISTDAITADNDSGNIDASNVGITSDYTGNIVSTVFNPIITSNAGIIASQRRETAIYKVIQGYDYNGNTVTFSRDGALPSGLTGSNVGNTYVISGTIANAGVGTQDVTFTLTPIKYYGNTQVNGDSKSFTITVLGKIEDTPVWLTEPNLGTLDNSVNSQLYVQVGSESGLEFSYRLSDASDPLPDGLELKSDGTIVGKIRADIPDGTVYQFSFIVEAGSARETVTREFTISTRARTGLPFRNLYMRLMPPVTKRKSYYDVVNNSDIIPYESIYRPLDPWFGVNRLRRIHFAAGLEAKTVTQLLTAMESHHWWKNLRLGTIKTAEAKDQNLNPVYEIVYAEIVDDAKVGDSLPDANVTITSNDTEITVDSNSLDRMVEQIVNQINYEDRGIIPLWMRTRQRDGRVPGFKIVFPLVYTKPGKSAEIAERLRAQQESLSSGEFTVDRYEFDGVTVNSPQPLVLAPNTDILANNTINVANIIGQTSVTLTTADYKFLNSNQNSIVLFDGMKLKFTYAANTEYRLDTFVVANVDSSINLIRSNLQTITSNSSNGYVSGTNTFFATNTNPSFQAYQIHEGDWVVTGNGTVVGKVETVISNTNLKLNANFTITNVTNTTYSHTNWIPQGVPVEGDKYLIFQKTIGSNTTPRIKVYDINE